MKKLMTATSLAFLLGTTNHAQEKQYPYAYDGPRDDTFWAHGGDAFYDWAVFETTLGILARYSDIIGMGQVSNKTNDHFTVMVDHALYGCTNGAVIVVYDKYELYNDTGSDRHNYLPTNNSHIVFAVCTNDFNGGGPMYWNFQEVPIKPERILPNISLQWLDRSWWHVDRDDGLLTIQFTNVLHTVRLERNWTNYFYLCRDGAFSASNRVREDSFWDMRFLSIMATLAQKPFILADTLVDPKHKALLNIPGWGNPNLEEPHLQGN